MLLVKMTGFIWLLFLTGKVNESQAKPLLFQTEKVWRKI